MNTSYTLEEIDTIAKQLLETSDSKIFLFYGDMGVGKTTLIKALCKALGVMHTTNSPTFSLVNEYEGKKDLIYHFDLYRLEDEAAVLDLGFEDYLLQDAYIFIEWPEKILSFLTKNYKKIELNIFEDKRVIHAF